MRFTVIALLVATLGIAQDTSLVISQVYIGENSRYVELFNRGRQDASLDGLSLQSLSTSIGYSYPRGAGHSVHGGTVVLAGLLQPGQHYLVSLGPVVGAQLTTPDASGPRVFLSDLVGSIALVRGAEPIPGWPTRYETVDLFAYRRADSIYNGRPYLTNAPLGTTSFFRRNGGCQDTRNNADDFEEAAPRLRNAASAFTPCPILVKTPVINQGGILHAATLSSGPLASGTVIIIRGKGFVPDRTQVYFDGVPAPVFVVAEDRILLQVPPLRGSGKCQVVVRAAGADSAPSVMDLSEASPGIYSKWTMEYDGLPPLNENGSWNSEGSGANPGSLVVVTLTGATFGELSATVGGRPADIAHVETVPSFVAGLLKVSIRMPAADLKGAQPLRVLSRNSESPAVWVYLNTRSPMHRTLGLMRVRARDIAYDPYRHLLYAGTQGILPSSSSSSSPYEPDSILVIDPIDRTVVRTIRCAASPYQLAVSQNGRYLWIAADRDQALQRIDLDTFKVEFTIALRDLYPDIGDRPLDRIGVTRLVPLRGNGESVVVAASNELGGLPLIVLDGTRRRTRLGPPSTHAFFDPETGLILTSEYGLRLVDDGPEVEYRFGGYVSSFEPEQSVVGGLMDRQGRVRRRGDFLRTGSFPFASLGLQQFNSAQAPNDDELVYSNLAVGISAGPGSEHDSLFAVQSFDPHTMRQVGQYVYTYSSRDGNAPQGEDGSGRFISLAEEGFARVLGVPFDRGPYGGNGGDILLIPKSLVEPVRPFPLPQLTSDANVKKIDLPVAAAAVDPTSTIVYLALSSDIPGIGNSIVALDTANGHLGSPVWVGSEPDAAVVSQDGRFLYVALFGSGSVRRFSLPDLRFDLEFHITDEGTVDHPFTGVVELIAPPGSPSTSVAAVRAFYGLGGTQQPRGVVLYDDGVPRVSSTAGADTGYAQFSPTGAWLFTIGNSSTAFPAARWRVTERGFEHQETRLNVAGGFQTRLRCTDQFCITSSGIMYDPYTLERIRMFDSWSSLDSLYGSIRNGLDLEVDPSNDRVYFLRHNGVDVRRISSGEQLGRIDAVAGGRIRFLPSGELLVYGGRTVFVIKP